MQKQIPPTFTPPTDEHSIPQRDLSLETPIDKPTETETKTAPVLMIILVILLILSLVSTIYFAYQNMQLTKQITNLKATPTPISIISPSPIAAGISNGQTYTSSDLGLSFIYSSDLQVTNLTSVDQQLMNSDSAFWVARGYGDVIPLEVDIYNTDQQPNDWWQLTGKKLFDSNWKNNLPGQLTQVSPIGGKDTFGTQATIDGQLGNVVISVLNDNHKIYLIVQSTDNNGLLITNQILSTFKFTN